MNILKAAELLKRHDKILILTHRRPDGDTVGCAAALCLALRQLGKTAYVFYNEDAHSLFDPYFADVLAPADFSWNYLVAVDVAALNMLTPGAEELGAIDLCIDHHGTNGFYAKETCVDPACAACGELLYQIFLKMEVKITEKIAMLLYMAIATDTGCFVYSNTRPETHRIAADLMESGFDHQWVNKRHFRTKSYKRFQLESWIVRDMDLLDQGKLVFASITLEMMASLQASEEDVEDIAAFVGQLEGVESAVTLRELNPGECKMSLRTGKSLDAAAVCAQLGGGGHPAAAGCTVYGTVAEAKAAMLNAIRQVMHG